MKEQLISFDTAKLAKEKGFIEICDSIYVSIGILEKYIKLSNKWERDYTFCTAPTQSLLQKWLREIHNIHIKIHSYNSNRFSFEVYEMIPEKTNLNKEYFHYVDNRNFKNYEDVLESGLQYSLKVIL